MDSYKLLIWNGYSGEWDVLARGTKEYCEDSYDRHILYYRTGVKMRIEEDE